MMKKRRSMFMFGIHCVRCNNEIIAPHKSEFLDDKVIRHLWHCPRCKAWFESFPRLPANARFSVREVTERWMRFHVQMNAPPSPSVGPDEARSQPLLGWSIRTSEGGCYGRY